MLNAEGLQPHLQTETKCTPKLVKINQIFAPNTSFYSSKSQSNKVNDDSSSLLRASSQSMKNNNITYMKAVL